MNDDTVSSSFQAPPKTINLAPKVEQIPLPPIWLPGSQKTWAERVEEAECKHEKEEIAGLEACFGLQIPQREGKRNLTLVRFDESVRTEFIDLWTRHHAYQEALTDDLLAVASQPTCRQAHGNKTIVALGSKRYSRYTQALRLYTVCNERRLGPISLDGTWPPTTWFLLYHENLVTTKTYPT